MNKGQVAGWIAFSMAIIIVLCGQYQYFINGVIDWVGVFVSLLLFVCAIFLIGENKK